MDKISRQTSYSSVKQMGPTCYAHTCARCILKVIKKIIPEYFIYTGDEEKEFIDSKDTIKHKLFDIISILAFNTTNHRFYKNPELLRQGLTIQDNIFEKLCFYIKQVLNKINSPPSYDFSGHIKYIEDYEENRDYRDPTKERNILTSLLAIIYYDPHLFKEIINEVLGEIIKVNVNNKLIKIINDKVEDFLNYNNCFIIMEDDIISLKKLNSENKCKVNSRYNQLILYYYILLLIKNNGGCKSKVKITLEKFVNNINYFKNNETKDIYLIPYDYENEKLNYFYFENNKINFSRNAKETITKLLDDFFIKSKNKTFTLNTIVINKEEDFLKNPVNNNKIKTILLKNLYLILCFYFTSDDIQKIENIKDIDQKLSDTSTRILRSSSMDVTNLGLSHSDKPCEPAGHGVIITDINEEKSMTILNSLGSMWGSQGLYNITEPNFFINRTCLDNGKIPKIYYIDVSDKNENEEDENEYDKINEPYIPIQSPTIYKQFKTATGLPKGLSKIMGRGGKNKTRRNKTRRNKTRRNTTRRKKTRRSK